MKAAIRAHFKSAAGDDDPDQLLAVVERVLARAEQQQQQQSSLTRAQEEEEEEEDYVSPDKLRRLEREVDALEAKVASLRRSVPAEAKLFYARRQPAHIAEIRSSVDWTSTVADKPDETTTAYTAEEAAQAGQRVHSLFKQIEQEMPCALDRAENNLAALRSAAPAPHTTTTSAVAAPPPSSPTLELGKQLSQAITKRTRLT